MFAFFFISPLFSLSTIHRLVQHLTGQSSSISSSWLPLTMSPLTLTPKAEPSLQTSRLAQGQEKYEEVIDGCSEEEATWGIFKLTAAWTILELWGLGGAHSTVLRNYSWQGLGTISSVGNGNQGGCVQGKCLNLLYYLWPKIFPSLLREIQMSHLA